MAPEPTYGGTKISGDRPCGLAVQGVTSDLATCGAVQDVLAPGILNKNLPSGVCEWGLTCVLALARFGLTTVFPALRVPTPPGKSWIFFLENSRTWKVLENHFGPGKSWKLKLKVLESPGKISLKVMHFSSGSNGK